MYMYLYGYSKQIICLMPSPVEFDDNKTQNVQYVYLIYKLTKNLKSQ